MATLKTGIVQSKLSELIEYMKPLLPFANCHMVNFITKNCWETYVPNAIKIEFEDQGVEHMFNVFWNFARNRASVDADALKHSPSLVGFLENTQLMSLGSLKDVSISCSEFCDKLSSWNCQEYGSLHLDQFMSRKKTHEVEVMSGMVAALTCASRASHIVDVGGGKGYLSSMLALHHGLKVLSVDSSQINTQGALKRTEKLQKVWNGVRRRADAVDGGEVRTRRGKHWKSKSQERTPSSDSNVPKNLENVNSMGETLKNPSSDSDGELQMFGNGQVSKSLYKQATVFVTQQTNLEKLVEEYFDNSPCSGISLAGLHTCGNLASTCLRLFINDKQIKSLCNVGCCYHLIEEKFFTNPFPPPAAEAVEYGFPMSNFLMSQNFALGRNARMLAAQSLDRMSEKEQVPSESLFYRALLQVLLVKKCGEDLPHWQVGRIATKCKDFTDYVTKAFTKLNINIEVSSAEIENLYESNVEWQQKLQAFFLLRVALAPLIEAIMLLDRLLYLHEQGIEEAYLVQLFDPVVSPRCYGLIAVKETPANS